MTAPPSAFLGLPPPSPIILARLRAWPAWRLHAWDAGRRLARAQRLRALVRTLIGKGIPYRPISAAAAEREREAGRLEALARAEIQL